MEEKEYGQDPKQEPVRVKSDWQKFRTVIEKNAL